jgi:hypothetical protein
VKTADLEAEHREAVKNLTTEDAQELVDQLLIPWFAVIIYQLVGIMPIRREGWLWEPDPDGELAYITPLRIERIDTALSLEPWETTRWGELVDLIAWDPRAPRRWALRTASTLWLGSIPFGEPFPAMIRATPLSWLQADCDGLVLLTRDPVELRSIFAEFEYGIHAESDILTAQLTKLVRQPVANPPLILTQPPPGDEPPRANYGPGSSRRRQAEAHWGSDNFTPLRAEGED